MNLWTYIKKIDIGGKRDRSQMFRFWQPLFTLSRYTPRCVPAVCSRRTGAKRDESGRNSSAFIYSRQCYQDQARLGAQIDHGMSGYCYGLRRCIPGVDPEALRCVPARPDTPRFCPRNRRQSLGFTTADHVSRTAKHRCFTAAYEYQCIFRETYNRNVLAKYRTQFKY